MSNTNKLKKFVLASSIYFSVILLVIVIARFEVIFSAIKSFISIMSPIIIGFFLAYLLNPILKFYERTVFVKIKGKLALRIVSMTCTYLSLVVFLVFFGWLTIPKISESVLDLATKIDVYEASTINLVNSALERFSTNEMVAKQIDPGAIISFISEQFADGEEIAKLVLSYITTNYKEILSIPLNVLIGLFISVYVLGTKERLGAQFKKFLSTILTKNANEYVSNRLARTHSTFGGYFTGVLLDAIFIGVASFFIMMILGIPYASLISVVLAITNVIPIFGPFIGTIPSAFLIFIADPSKVIPFVIAIIVLQQIDGNIVAPRILGGSTGLSSLGVIVAITVMGSTFGFIGMLIGVPVFAVLTAIIKDFVNETLAKKELSTSTTDYYHKDSIFIPSDEKKPGIVDKVIEKSKHAITKLFKKSKENRK